MNYKQFLVVCGTIIVASFGTIHECHDHIVKRWTANGFKSDFDVVNRFEEPGEIECVSGRFHCWRAS